MWHSESSPDLNSIHIATFLPSSPLSGGICNIGDIFNDCHFCFFVILLFVASMTRVWSVTALSVPYIRFNTLLWGGHSSFPSVILNSCFSFADHGSVPFLYLVVMNVAMDAAVVALACSCWEVYLCSLLVE